MSGKKNRGPKGSQFSSSAFTGAKKGGEEIIFGRRPVLEALKSGLPPTKIYIHEGARGATVKEINQLAEKKGIPVLYVKREELELVKEGQKHQGVVAYTAPYTYFSVEELLEEVQKKQKIPFFLLLDHLQDPHNFGSLVRTACAAGVDGIIIPRDRACGVTPAVFKTSAGSLAHVPVARSVNLAREVDFLKKEGFWLMGADMSGDLPFFRADFSLPLVLLLGSEGYGLSRLLREKCDFLLRIPMQGPVASLNVAVAGGIIMYEVFRQRELEKNKGV